MSREKEQSHKYGNHIRQRKGGQIMYKECESENVRIVNGGKK